MTKPKIASDWMAGCSGCHMSLLDIDERLLEIAELADHPYMVGSQFHPEFLSRPMTPHPLFMGLVKAAKERAKK